MNFKRLTFCKSSPALRRVISVAALSAVILAVFSLFQSRFSVSAAVNLTITPITWNVVGLDSNNVNVGPNTFPVGARVCNTGSTATTTLSSAFVWDSADTYIDLRSGSSSSYSGVSLAGGGSCKDFFYEVQVTRNSAAYNHTRRYHITATEPSFGTVSTTTPREIFVEHLISQNRNSVSDVKLDNVSQPSGSTMSLIVGKTYDIKLVGSTATQGYNQIETFITLANTIFQVNSITTTYSAGSGFTDTLYADACGWDNNPSSITYRSCVGSDNKNGGDVTVTFNVTIIGGAGTSQTMSTLIYDFSGSSYHYNSELL